MRNVSLAHVVVKLRDLDGESYYLLHRHQKWGDWTLVGGHVEPGEEDYWARTARRETEEEIPSLQHSRDFTLVPLLSAPISWGPRESRSAGGEPTMYRAQFFRMVFRRDPAPLIAGLAGSGFTLVREDQLPGHVGVGDLLRQLARHVSGGLAAVPAAWSGPSVAMLLSHFSASPDDGSATMPGRN